MGDSGEEELFPDRRAGGEGTSAGFVCRIGRREYVSTLVAQNFDTIGFFLRARLLACICFNSGWPILRERIRE